MKFTLEIESDNAAFVQHGGRVEVNRILLETAEKLLEGYDTFTLRDINGNTVGRAEFDKGNPFTAKR